MKMDTAYIALLNLKRVAVVFHHQSQEKERNNITHMMCLNYC